MSLLQLFVSPLFRLVSKANATLKDVGTPEGVVAAIGNFITGERLAQALHRLAGKQEQPCASNAGVFLSELIFHESL